MAGLVEIGPVVLERKLKNVSSLQMDSGQNDIHVIHEESGTLILYNDFTQNTCVCLLIKKNHAYYTSLY